ncbi:MAG TPA: hypothetical protein VEH53_05445 [archaeon]|nr:hypothetical protein [archaeon]
MAIALDETQCELVRGYLSNWMDKETAARAVQEAEGFVATVEGYLAGLGI